MSKCRCGCGGEIEEGKAFLKGHWSKFNANNKKGLEKSQPEPTSQPATPTTKPLYIRGLVEYTGDLVAWFKTEQGYKYLEPVMFGLMADDVRAESIPVCLVLMPDGQAIPPFIVEGFVGMHPENQVFDEPGTSEPFPPFPEEKEPEKPIVKILPPQEIQPITQLEKPKEAFSEAIESRVIKAKEILEKPNYPKNEGLIGKFVRAIYTKKEKPPVKLNTQTVKLNTQTEILLEKLKNVSG